MITFREGTQPKFQATHEDLPFTKADVDYTFGFIGKIMVDGMAPEGPCFTLKVLQIEFPEKEQGTLKSRKKKRMKTTSGVTINIQS